ncbi:nitrous oxide reductase accessory protein NosL [Salinilacihabitans rarus]|uniref:nitrous oxide reductase accessory protein NosL n=1 Tax=Salinilacihabitans rarus TaxID=2961596 RepID=UPI0020C8E4F9|nr:nitrous oxide reductase accessory protein NosL [Salinilacihabitans rarus]
MDERPIDATSTVDRRTVLAGAAIAGVGALAGCLGEDDVPDPVSIEDGRECDNCGMMIAKHPGPVGESFYEADAGVTDDPEAPAQFCSGTCTYAFGFDQADAGHESIVTYATDYSSVDWDLETSDGETAISAHLDAEAFAPVTDLTFVGDSDVEGAMGASLIGFSDADDADAFVDEHGGDRYEDEDVTRELISSLMM